MEKDNKFLLNTVNEGDGLKLLKSIEEEKVQLIIFDPQYENVKEATAQHKDMGNQVAFHAYPIIEQTEMQINDFCQEIKRVLKPNGYLALWINRKILVNGNYQQWLPQGLKIKEILIWNKRTLGLGWGQFRNQVEYCILIQKWPYVVDSKGKGIGNVFGEFLNTSGRSHVHKKPYKMTRKIIKQLTKKGDLVVDPCAGSFIVLIACQKLKRNFLGTDLTLREVFNFNINKENSRMLLRNEKPFLLDGNNGNNN